MLTSSNDTKKTDHLLHMTGEMNEAKKDSEQIGYPSQKMAYYQQNKSVMLEENNSSENNQSQNVSD